MDVTTAIGGAIATTKTVLGLTRVAASAAVDHQVKDRIIEVQQGILDIQGQLGDAQAERLELLDEVHALKEKLRASDDAKERLSGYELQALDDGKFLYASLEEAGHKVKHYACPDCHSGGRVSVVQARRSGQQQTHYRCGVCKFNLWVGPSDPPQVRQVISPMARHGGWMGV